MYQQQLSDHDGYELFRRAIVDGSDDAWNDIYAYFRPLLLSWTRQYRTTPPSSEQPEDIADRALARAWVALSPERFAQFSNLAALLGYLRSCVGATMIDLRRMEATRERVYQQLEPRPVATPEQIVVDHSTRAALWGKIAALALTERERIILNESFTLGLAPRQIHARHPDSFADVTDVYGVKRNLLCRLERSRALRQLREDWQA